MTSSWRFEAPPATVTIAFNVFMNVVVRADGRLDIRPPVSTAGQGLTFVAERDVVVAVTACPAATCNGGGGTRPLRVDIATPAS